MVCGSDGKKERERSWVFGKRASLPAEGCHLRPSLGFLLFPVPDLSSVETSVLLCNSI